MRETNINKTIDRSDIKAGDTIRITRDVVVKAVRQAQLSQGRPAAIVTTKNVTLAITEDESVTLLERDKESEIKIPLSATHLFWQDTDDYDYYARYYAGSWRVSGAGGITYTTDNLIKEIENPLGEFDEYKEGSFQVLKELSAGGMVSGYSAAAQGIARMSGGYIPPLATGGLTGRWIVPQ